MPAPNRRNVGASLAHQIDAHAGPRSIDSRRDRLVAQRSRTDAKWAEAAARLAPAAVLDRRQVNEDQREALRIENAQHASASAFRRVLDTACPAHGVSPGEPCWWPLDHAALCGDRIRRAGYVGQVSARTTYTRGGRR